jgi:cytochrome c556
MKRATVLLTALALSFAAASAEAQGDKVPAVKDIMMKVNKPTGLYFNIGKELREKDPMWPEVQQDAKEVARLAALLGKNAPPKGDKESWEKLTKEYAANAAALEKAVAAKDQAAAKAAWAKMGGDGGAACNACHKAHRSE